MNLANSLSSSMAMQPEKKDDKHGQLVVICIISIKQDHNKKKR
jgi:hypothetical protein